MHVGVGVGDIRCLARCERPPEGQGAPACEVTKRPDG